MKKAIVIGASSGIGRALALTLAKHDYEVGLMARCVELLKALQQEIPTKTEVAYLDLSQVSDAIKRFRQLLQEMGEVDLIVISSADRILNPELDHPAKKIPRVHHATRAHRLVIKDTA